MISMNADKCVALKFCLGRQSCLFMSTFTPARGGVWLGDDLVMGDTADVRFIETGYTVRVRTAFYGNLGRHCGVKGAQAGL